MKWVNIFIHNSGYRVEFFLNYKAENNSAFTDLINNTKLS